MQKKKKNSPEYNTISSKIAGITLALALVFTLSLVIKEIYNRAYAQNRESHKPSEKAETPPSYSYRPEDKSEPSTNHDLIASSTKEEKALRKNKSEASLATPTQINDSSVPVLEGTEIPTESSKSREVRLPDATNLLAEPNVTNEDKIDAANIR
jgi:hypothetical protein